MEMQGGFTRMEGVVRIEAEAARQAMAQVRPLSLFFG